MTLLVGVLGASGVYGRHLIPRLVSAGYRVRALVRRPEAAAVASANGAEVRAADIFDPDALRDGLVGCEIAINLATALPSPGRSGGDFALNDRVRREGVPIFLTACAMVGVSRVIQQSIAMVHCGGGEAWADEDSFFRPLTNSIAGSAIAAALDMEGMVRNSSVDWIILRGGLFYGPGTGFDDDWFARARSGKLRLPEAGEDYVTLVHIADMADATVAALARWPSRKALVVADSAPSRWRDLFNYIARLSGGSPPKSGGPASLPSFRVSNKRAMQALAWSPRYPDYRVGLVR
jgi:nucleoside-diphosphate-sugar epimerase